MQAQGRDVPWRLTNHSNCMENEGKLGYIAKKSINGQYLGGLTITSTLA